MRDNYRWFILSFAALALSGCTSSDDGSLENDDGVASDSFAAESGELSSATGNSISEESYSSSSDDERADFDEDAAREAAEEEVGSDSYTGVGAPYGCTEDCSGHEAGFNWRRDNGYAASGNSQSFDEGGRAFDEAVDDRVEEMRDGYESGEDPDY